MSSNDDLKSRELDLIERRLERISDSLSEIEKTLKDF